MLTSGASFETQGDEVADENWPITRKGMSALGKRYDEMVSEIKTEKSIPLIEMLPSQIYVGKHIFYTLTMNTEVSNELIKKELGWKPKYPSYREGLKT